MSRAAAVVIGRNEGPRLARSLRSVTGAPAPVVYVDSGSNDDSVAIARAAGVPVVVLDDTQPFTAARARNAGLAEVVRRAPDVELVQFVDGDCVLAPGWLDAAAALLERCPDVVAVRGHQRERFPCQSGYQRLYELEWRTFDGRPQTFAGVAMLRVRALRAVGGYDEALAGGEERDLALRLRGAGWHVVCLDRDMALHESAMMNLRDWWRRGARLGDGNSRLAMRYWRHSERPGVRAGASALVWAILLPGAALAATWGVGVAGLLVLGAYPAHALRIYRRVRADGTDAGDAALYAAACLAGKLPQAYGQLRALGTWGR